MKPKGKMLSLLLAICLVVGLLPTAVFAADGDKTIMLGASGMKDPTAEGNTYYTPNSYIYFGVNGSDPIKWRVLDADSANDNHTDGMFLLSEYLLETDVYFQQSCHQDSNGIYHKGSAPSDGDHSGCLSANAWQGSDAQAWCQTFSSNLSNFSAAEQSAMVSIAKADDAEINLYKFNWGESSLTTDDKMFFLSVRELADYVGSYDKAPGMAATFLGGREGVWRLRSPSVNFSMYAPEVSRGGIVFPSIPVDRALDVRPAFNLDLNFVLFTSAAIGGKSADGMDSRLTVVDNCDSNEWKLTLLDESRNFSISNAATNSSGDTIAFSYSGAQTGTNEYISVVIVDNGAITHYGRILQLDGTAGGTSGTASLMLPAGVTLDNDTKLYVFNEQYNGGENDDTKLTDYGSQLIEVVKPTVDTTAPTLTAGDVSRTGETAATVKFISDEAGTYYYAVVESGADEPIIDTTDVGTFCDTAEQTISLDNLLGTGAKDIYIVAKDAIGNVSQLLKIEIPVTYTLTVNLNGGSGSTIGGEYTDGEEISIDAGTKSGYRFTSWTSSNGGTFADASSASTTFTMPANDTTITANWKKKSSGGSVFFWDLKFDTNGGSDINTVSEWEFSTIDLDEYVPEKEGYKFVGWYADEDLTKKIDEVYLTQDTTIYAKWEKIEEEVPEETEEVEETEETKTISFKDVKKSDWFYEAVSYAVENSLMSGMSEDAFAPNTPLTREMLAVVLYNVEDQPESTEANTFTDVKGDMWYTEAILWANANGIVAGYDNGAYGVGDLITREQFATILYRYAQFKGYDTTQGGMAVREFSDYENISDYARPAMAWAVNTGIMGGNDDGTLNPQGKATRAEAATMLMNFCENVVKK